MKQAAKTYGEGKKYDFATARVPHAIYGAHGASMPHVPHAIYGNFGHVGSKSDHRARATSSRVRPSAKTSGICSNAEPNTASVKHGLHRACDRSGSDADADTTIAKPGPANEGYVATFKRTEKKYCLNTTQYQAILACVQKHLQPDAYPQTVVSSLYFDTPENQLISRSLEKPLYKEKLRMRSYGTLLPDGSFSPASDQVFIELKKKYKGVVYKRRLALSVEEARALLADVPAVCNVRTITPAAFSASSIPGAFAPDSFSPTFRERQVAREIAVLLQRHPDMRPAMITQCMRTAWRQPESQLRITFDAQLRAGHPFGDPFAFQLDRFSMDLLQPGYVLMEIKQAGGLPLWLVNALSENHAYPRSFSKYGTAYEKEVKNA